MTVKPSKTIYKQIAITQTITLEEVKGKGNLSVQKEEAKNTEETKTLDSSMLLEKETSSDDEPIAGKEYLRFKGIGIKYPTAATSALIRAAFNAKKHRKQIIKGNYK
jgi:hypothetical protein